MELSEKEYIYLFFDLQLFAAEDEGRTVEPTERRLREARERGQLPKTIELPSALILLGTFVVLYFLMQWTVYSIGAIFRNVVRSISTMGYNVDTLRVIAGQSFIVFMQIIIPVMLTAALLGFMGNVLQVGFRFTTYPLRWDWSKISFTFTKMMQRIFFSKQVAMNLFKTVFKVVVVIVVAYLIVISDFETFIQMPNFSVFGALSFIFQEVFKIGIIVAILFLILSIPDYIFQKREFIESLKMTPEEFKRELKEEYGDPYVRQRMRERQREIAYNTMLREVPKADVVITNPTHYAVALLYEIGSIAPKVVAKGSDYLAYVIKNIARRNDVPIIEDRELARNLYASVDVGDFIPEEFFEAIARILAVVYRDNNPEKYRRFLRAS